MIEDFERDGAGGGRETAPSQGSRSFSSVDGPLLEDRPRPRLAMGVGAAIVLVLLALAVAIAVGAFRPQGGALDLSGSGTAPTPSTSAPAGEQAASGAEPLGIYVHVLGAVTAPGIYQLKPDVRVLDAIAAAGGFLPEADQSALNLARPLSDGEQLYVPLVGETPPAGTQQPGGGAPGVVGGAGALVNLNQADLAALDTLPGVGPVTAQKILDFRDQNGPFTSIDQLLEVSGIGDKTFENLKSLVTV